VSNACAQHDAIACLIVMADGVIRVNVDIVGVLWCAQSASRSMGMSPLYTVTVTSC